MTVRSYAGIGSRKTPAEVLELMVEIGKQLADRGFLLRSGGADGADSAFEQGCDAAGGKKTIFLPWAGFNGRQPREGVFAGVGENALQLASRSHPAWERLSRGGKALHARNGYQVLGPQLDDPVEFIVCWTPGGSGSGGTGQALRLARERGIQIHDLGELSVLAKWRARLEVAVCG